MRGRRDGTHSCFLFESTDDLEENPKNENELGIQSNPAMPDESQAPQKSESHPRKIQRVKRNDGGNAAAGADARCLRTRIKSDMRQVTDEAPG